MVVAGGSIVKVVPLPDSEASAYECLQTLKATYHGGDWEFWDEDFDQMQLIASWFRQYADEITTVLQPAQAIDHCRSYLKVSGNRTLQGTPCVALRG
jgi:hypothetical protein